MQRREDNVAARLNGNALQPLSEVFVTVTDDKTGLPATLYSDNGVTPLAQPLKTDNNGYYGYYAANGEYTESFSGSRIETFERKVVLQDPDDNPYASKAELAAGSGASLVTFTQAGEGAVSRSTQDKLRDTVSVKDYGAQGIGGDDTAAILLAISKLPNGGTLRFPGSGVWGISAPLVTSDASPITFKGDGDCSVIKKLFNGDMVNLGKRSQIHDLVLDGNGANFTGRGVIMSTGGVDHSSWRHLKRCNIINMQGYPVEYTAAIAGYGSVIEHCTLESLNGALAAVKYPAAETNGNRRQLSCNTSGPVAETAGVNNLLIFDNDGAPPIMSASTVKARIIGNRFPFSAPTPTWTVDGVDTYASGNQVGSSGIVFAATLNNSTYADNSDMGAAPTITDNAPGASNRIDIGKSFRTVYTPVWVATGGTPDIGNGSLSGSWSRNGQYCRANVVLTIGSTTVKAGTDWTLTVPYKAARNHIGQVFVQQSGTGLKQYAGTALIASGASRVHFNVAGFTDPVGVAVPAAWSANDLIICDIEYSIQ